MVTLVLGGKQLSFVILFTRQYFKEAQRKYTYLHQIPYHFFGD